MHWDINIILLHTLPLPNVITARSTYSWHSVIMQLKVQSSHPPLHSNTKPHAVPAAFQHFSGVVGGANMLFDVHHTDQSYKQQFLLRCYHRASGEPAPPPTRKKSSCVLKSLLLESSLYDALFKKTHKRYYSFFFLHIIHQTGKMTDTFMACTSEADVISEVDFFIVILSIRPKETGR